MRVVTVLFVLVAASLSLVQPARGLSDKERLLKVARKYAVAYEEVQLSNVKPKTLCYCTGEPVRTLGFLAVKLVDLTVYCGVPTNITAEGAFQMVVYTCADFEILSR